jgi:DMSO reductase family type II enzyme heme b subunit
MGERKKPVNIWHWKADASQVISRNPGRTVSTHHEKLFVNPFSETPVEELNALGFGSLYVQSLQNQQLQGNGAWKDGQWTLVLIRDLATPSRQDINFKRGNRFLLAFAVWDGANKDKNANKVVSFWKTLILNHDASSP